MPYGINPIIKPIFSGSVFNYTWATGGGNTLTSPLITIMEKEKEIGNWTLFLAGNGAVNLTIKLYYFLRDGIYSSVGHVVEAYINGEVEKQSTFLIADGIDAPLNAQDWWLYNPDGFKLVITRASDVQVIFTHGSVKAI